MKIGRWLLLALVLLGGAWGVVRWRRGASPGTRTETTSVPNEIPDDSTARAPTGVRVRVQVLNASTTRGLARGVTKWLRSRGFDVVDFGNTSEKLDSTLVLDRSGHLDWAKRAAKAMGGARVEARPDSSRYLDVTVLVGRTWRAPAQALDP